MASPKRPDIQENDLQGFKLFKLLMPVLEKLHHHGCERDTAGNRKLHYDQYAALILLYFFNPIVTSLRGIIQAGGLKKVQRMLKCSRAAVGSVSEASRVFDADLLRGVIGELVDKLEPIRQLYYHRWAIETFFRFFKHVLGCRHRLARPEQVGVDAGRC